jgi:hypothetical protein
MPPAERRKRFLASSSATTRALPTVTRTLQTTLKELPVAEEVEGFICHILCVDHTCFHLFREHFDLFA